VAIELNKQAKAEALASLQRFLDENLDERVGNVAVGALLNFFVEEVGPAIYNQAVTDVQEKLSARLQELDLEVHEDEFPYWRRQGPSGRRQRR
jgi:uncharacterized protein (DUF2164 family)